MKGLFKIYLIVFILSFNSCHPDTRTYSSQGCRDNFRTVNINKIINSPSKYDGQFVEVSGYYYLSFEQTALLPYVPKNKYQSVKMLWILFGGGLYRKKGIDSIFLDSSLEEYQRINGKRIKIRGIVNAAGHGHLGQYTAEINNICYLRILD